MKRLSILMLILLTCFVSAAWPQTQAQWTRQWLDDPGQLGHYAVGHTSYTLTDSNNGNRPVIFMVWYPVDKSTISSSSPPAQYPLDPYFGTTHFPITLSTDWEPLGYDPSYEGLPPSKNAPFPLVVFSPGFGDDAWQHIFLGTRLASHGYVVAVADHYADCSWSWTPCDEFVTIMLNRVRDVSFIISQLLTRNRTPDELLFRTIDPKRIALSGHSLGGYPTYALAGGDKLVCDALWPALVGLASLPYPPSTCVPIPRDPHVKLVIPLDGASHLLRYRELSRISIPSLIMGETVDQEEQFGISRTWIARLTQQSTVLIPIEWTSTVPITIRSPIIVTAGKFFSTSA